MSETDENIEDIPTDAETTIEASDTEVKSETGTEIEETATFLEEDDEYGPFDPYQLSGPQVSENCTIPVNILEFDFSYGYSCQKFFNLTVLDPETVLFASGNFLNFFDTRKRKILFRRTVLGGGLGNIRKNPNPEYPYFAVAECGETPVILLYQWPTMDFLCVLRGGAAKVYSNMDFSPDGELLVSQGGEPDYLITIWKWQEHHILLRTKSYVNDVYRVKFSPYVEGQLASCGIAHIKFWKMASTFTGLKLKGELGRFGKTEYSDIIGVFPMPDGKVVSGCDWGNILVWDEGLIHLEIFRTQRRKCHDGPVVQFYFYEGELSTVSMDGHVKIWWYEKIDQADPPDDDRVVLLDPSYDFYTPGTKLYCIEKKMPSDHKDSWWYAQDGNGGIWLIDLNTDEDPKPSILLYKCHGGEVMDIATCPFDTYLATLGKDGKLFIYNYVTQKLTAQLEFAAKGACLIWVPLSIITYGDVILAAFDDGQVRVIRITISSHDNVDLYLTQITKPHAKPITVMQINPTGELLVTGSEEQTIFIFKIDAMDSLERLLTPIGFITTPDIVTCMAWNPLEQYTVLVGCIHGQMMEVTVPEVPQNYTTVSFMLRSKPKYKTFHTYKAQIRRDIKISEIEARKAVKVEKKRKEMERIKKENPGLEIDEETFLADSDSEEELEPLFIPEVPNRIFWLKYTDDETIWLSLGGYDAGYIYEYKMELPDDVPYRFKMVDDADDVEISSYVQNKTKEFMIFAMQDGTIRINKVNPEDWHDLSDYWSLAMHDNQYGFIPRMCFSYNERYFFSCGYDGNIFSYKFLPENYPYDETFYKEEREARKGSIGYVKDLDGYNKLSIEQTMMKQESDRILKLANEHKARIRDILKSLKERYAKLLQNNQKLLPSQIIPREQLEPDKRVLDYVEKELQDKLDLVKRKLAYDLEKSKILMLKLKKYITDPCDMHPLKVTGINKPDLYIMTVRQRIMPQIFYTTREIVAEKLIEEALKGRMLERQQPPPKVAIQKAPRTAALEYFLLSLPEEVVRDGMGPKLDRMLDRYRQRRMKWEQRTDEWEEFMARKPQPDKNHPDDERLLTEAARNIGDYKMKEDDDYKPAPEQRETTMKKYKEVLDARLRQYKLRHAFISHVWEIRDRKYVVRERLLQQLEILKKLHEELPKDMHRFGPPIPDIIESEFPEKLLEPHVVLPEEEEDMPRDTSKELFVPVKPLDQEIRDLFLYETRYPPVSKGYFTNNVSRSETVKIIESEFSKLTETTEEPTAFEINIRTRRLNRELFTQHLIVGAMEEEIEEFNNVIEDAKLQRLPIHPRGNFVDIFIITLNLELNILKKFEDGEDHLSNKVNENLRMVHNLQDIYDVQNANKEEMENQIEVLLSEETKIQEKFKHATETNKFYDFLKKVFKKKYKPPKQKTDDESSSESSSSSSSETDEDDAASIDSRDFGIIKQDLNVCPKGCEPAIYNLTVELRSKRHKLEQEVKDLYRDLDVVKKDAEITTRKMNGLRTQLNASQKELEDFQKEKQRKLNEVMCTVILKLDQIYEFSPEVSNIEDFIVFSRTGLTNLYKRVGALEKEDFEQKSKYDTYLKHLTRMKKDIRYMQEKITHLHYRISELMLDKFGKKVDLHELELVMIQKSFQKSFLNELEEVVLKRMVYDLRIRLTDIKSIYIQEFNMWNMKIAKSQIELTKVIKDNTKKLELLQIINKEKNDLIKIVLSQPKKREHLIKTEEIYKLYLADVKKLEAILEDQCQQLEDLRKEIKALKTKDLPPTPIARETPPKKKSTAEEVPKEWGGDFDIYLDEDEMFPEKVVKQFIKMPMYFSTESEDLVTELLKDLLKNVDATIVENTENMIRSILSGIVGCTCVTDIMDEIIQNLPIDLSQNQRQSIQSVAEKLYQIQEPTISDESFEICARELLEEIIDTALGVTDHPAKFLAHLVASLVDTVPVDYLMTEESLTMVENKVNEKLEGSIEEIDTNSLLEEVDKIESDHKVEMLKILNIILERIHDKNED